MLQLLILLLAFVVGIGYAFRKRDLDHISTIGYSDPFLSWITAGQYIFDLRSLLAKGYASYPNGAFKIASIDQWVVVLNGEQYIESISSTDPTVLSGIRALGLMFQFTYTFGKDFYEKDFPVIRNVIHGPVTRNMDARIHDIYKEVESSFEDGIPGAEKAWVPVTAYRLALDVVGRIMTRYFFGEPHCSLFQVFHLMYSLLDVCTGNNPEFRSICEDATFSILKGRLLRPLPDFVKNIIAPHFTGFGDLRVKMEQHLGPLIHERLKERELHGADWKGEPSDLINWLISASITAKQSTSVSDICSKILVVCFTATHTTSAAFTALLYQLCLKPQDVIELREEVGTAVHEQGWTRQAVGSMHKLDSYLRESQRVHGLSDTAVVRMAMEKHTFPDGLAVPKGTYLAINAFARHKSDLHYENPDSFDGFRFVRGKFKKEQLLATTTSLSHHAFGHGKNACPGRFFASSEIKLMIAHLLMFYDFKLEKEVYPKKFLLETNSLPNHSANVLFKRRQE